jgi:hypothetical protein
VFWVTLFSHGDQHAAFAGGSSVEGYRRFGDRGGAAQQSGREWEPGEMMTGYLPGDTWPPAQGRRILTGHRLLAM